MIVDPDRALIAAVMSALLSAPSVAALIGPAVYDEPPSPAAPPYLLIGRSETTPYGDPPPPGAAGAVAQVLTLTVVSTFGGLEEARAIGAAVRAVLHDAPLVLDGWRLVSLRVVFVDTCRAADGHTILGLVRLRAVTEAV